MQYNFTTVHLPKMSDYDQTPIHTELKNFITFTEYSIVVQAFNSEGSGPKTLPKTTMTLEDGKLNTRSKRRRF